MRRKSRKNVGLIGLGIIGTRVAALLRSAGYNVHVWNRSPRSEPNFLGSAAEIAEACDVVQLFVPDASALFEVIDNMLPKLGERHTILCNATVGPVATRDGSRRVMATGAQFLDAPFT
ncbi:MAG: NAD(P)-binding domain-containing protein, partial [Verrucomicrobiota bacterium]|nr:NAD(P)-binding domain-containing protein [Verrucomicrobiota bacterium]